MQQELLTINEAAKIIYRSIMGHWEEAFGDRLPLWNDSPARCQGMLCKTVRRLAKLDNRHISPEVSHRLWWHDAILDGWEYGEKLDMTDLLHPKNPKMKPWELLTKDQKIMTDVVTCEFRNIRGRLRITQEPIKSSHFYVHTDVFNNYNNGR